MSFQRVHQFKSQNSQPSLSASQFAPRPFPVQEAKRPSTQKEIENEAFQQNKFEAFGLQLKEKSSVITPVEQERLGVLQARMDDFWAQRMERTKAQPNLLETLIRNSQVEQTTEPQASVQSNTIQAKSDMAGDRPDSSVEQRPNQTGMPDALKAGVESLSGYSLDDVRVHYNSPKPAQLKALAYTQGTEIHVAPGQEKHLPHEAWHIVQQAQGRVQPTMQMKDGVPVNDDTGLEHEADAMGINALSVGAPSNCAPERRDVLADGSSSVPRFTREDQSRLSPAQVGPNTLHPSQRNVVQRRVGEITTLGGLLNEFSDRNLSIFGSAITNNKQLMLDIIAFLDSHVDYSLRQVVQLIVASGYRHHWSIGNCNGDIWWNSRENAADMHVTGGVGASLSGQVLSERLQYFQRIFALIEKHGGPAGELQFHPTGAVVTKQLITAIAMACSSSWDLIKPSALMAYRKTFGAEVKRNRLAPKIDSDLLPEYFGFLEALRGVAGVRIIPTGGLLPLPPGIRQMGDEEQVKAMNTNMLENSRAGNERFESYRRTYSSPEVAKVPEMVPSMQVFVKAIHIPALLGVIAKVTG